jgi:hypothetical protein
MQQSLGIAHQAFGDIGGKHARSTMVGTSGKVARRPL